MEVQLKSIKNELHRCSVVDYTEESVMCIIRDEHTRKCIIERHTSKYTTYKNTQDNFIFKDDNDNIIGGINCNIYPGTRSYEIVKELPHEYIGQMDFIVFLLMYIYYNPAWKGFMVLNNED